VLIAVVSLVLSVICRSDVAYYDGLSETILSVALVRPKPGLFSVLCLSALSTTYVYFLRTELSHCKT